MVPTTLADDTQQEFINVLYYGPNGTGKTTNLAHLAHLGPVEYIRADRSVRKRPLTQLGVPIANIHPIDVLDTEAIVKKIHAKGGWREQLADDPHAFAGIVIDTATELIKRRLEQIVDDEWPKIVAQAKRNHEEPDKTKRYFVSRDYYQPITQEMRRVTRQLRDLPCHVGISAQVRRDTDENSGHLEIGPDVNPAFTGDLQAYMDFVIRTGADGFWPDTDETIFVGYPRHMDVYVGKDREHVLPSRLVEPTMDRVIAYVNGTLTKETDPRQAQYREVVAARRSRSRGRRGADDLGEED